MTEFKIIEAQAFHCGQLARTLRLEHQMGLSNFGVDIHRELRSTFDSSSMRKAWVIDGKLAALGGVIGSSLETTGYIWVAMSKLATRYPIEFVKECRRQLDEIMDLKRELACTVITDDSAACRFAAFMGFHTSHHGRGAQALSRFSRRDLVKFIKSEPDLRIPIGKGFVVALGFHKEVA